MCHSLERTGIHAWVLWEPLKKRVRLEDLDVGWMIILKSTLNKRMSTLKLGLYDPE